MSKDDDHDDDGFACLACTLDAAIYDWLVAARSTGDVEIMSAAGNPRYVAAHCAMSVVKALKLLPDSERMEFFNDLVGDMRDDLMSETFSEANHPAPEAVQ